MLRTIKSEICQPIMFTLIINTLMIVFLFYNYNIMKKINVTHRINSLSTYQEHVDTELL